MSAAGAALLALVVALVVPLIGSAGASPGDVVVVAASASADVSTSVTVGSNCAEVIKDLLAAPLHMKVKSVRAARSPALSVIYGLDGRDTYAVVVCGPGS